MEWNPKTVMKIGPFGLVFGGPFKKWTLDLSGIQIVNVYGFWKRSLAWIDTFYELTEIPIAQSLQTGFTTIN